MALTAKKEKALGKAIHNVLGGYRAGHYNVQPCTKPRPLVAIVLDTLYIFKLTYSTEP